MSRNAARTPEGKPLPTKVQSWGDGRGYTVTRAHGNCKNAEKRRRSCPRVSFFTLIGKFQDDFLFSFGAVAVDLHFKLYAAVANADHNR